MAHELVPILRDTRVLPNTVALEVSKVERLHGIPH